MVSNPAIPTGQGLQTRLQWQVTLSLQDCTKMKKRWLHLHHKDEMTGPLGKMFMHSINFTSVKQVVHIFHIFNFWLNCKVEFNLHHLLHWYGIHVRASCQVGQVVSRVRHFCKNTAKCILDLRSSYQLVISLSHFSSHGWFWYFFLTLFFGSIVLTLALILF